MENRVQLVSKNGATDLLQSVDNRSASCFTPNGGDDRRSER